jgi:hypothetical protein
MKTPDRKPLGDVAPSTGPLLALAPITVTGTPTALPSMLCNEVVIQNDPGSTNNLLVGSSTQQPLALIPGAAFVIQVTNMNLIFLKVSGSATANVLGRA